MRVTNIVAVLPDPRAARSLRFSSLSSRSNGRRISSVKAMRVTNIYFCQRAGQLSKLSFYNFTNTAVRAAGSIFFNFIQLVVRAPMLWSPFSLP